MTPPETPLEGNRGGGRKLPETSPSRTQDESINEGKYTQYERSSGVNGECITLSDGRVIPNPY